MAGLDVLNTKTVLAILKQVCLHSGCLKSQLQKYINFNITDKFQGVFQNKYRYALLLDSALIFTEARFSEEKYLNQI